MSFFNSAGYSITGLIAIVTGVVIIGIVLYILNKFL